MSEPIPSQKPQWPGYVLLILAVALAIAVGMYDDKPEIPEPSAPRIPPPAPIIVEPIPTIPPMKFPPPPPR